MSRQLDERIVSMEFDNKAFEKNAKTTINTLDKLKENLDFSDAGKGLDALEKSIKKVNFCPVEKSVENLAGKFYALKTAAEQAVRYMTNSFMDAGKKLAKSLSTDQWTSGFNKYESEISNMQTIMNSTGKSVAEVEEYLKELQWYADETSYGISDMMGALSSGIAAGRNMDELIPMIEGVANATAFAGKNAQEFSHVMTYAVNQAMQLGYLGTQDWKTLKSISTPAYQQAYLDAAEKLGKIKPEENSIANWGTLLTKKKFDTDVILEANKAFSDYTRAVYEMHEASIGTDEYISTAKAMEKLAKSYGQIGVAAFESAQTAKTYTEAVDAVKDAVSSSWSETWKILFGNIEQAKQLWTDFCEDLYDIFMPLNELRNYMLNGIFRTEMFNGLTGQEVTIEIILGLMESLAAIMETIGEAWEYVAPTQGAIDSIKGFIGVIRNGVQYIWTLGKALRDVNEAFSNQKDTTWNEFAKGLTGIQAVAGKVRSVLQGLASIIDLVAFEIKNSFKFAFVLARVVLNAFNVAVGDGTVSIFGMINAVATWIKENSILRQVMWFIIGLVATMVEGISSFIQENTFLVKAMEIFAKVTAALGTVGMFVFNVFSTGFSKVKKWAEDSGVLAIVMNALSNAFNFISKYAIIAYTAVKGWFESFSKWSKDNGNIQKMFTSIGTWFKNIPKFIGEAVRNIPKLFENFKTVVPNIFAGLTNGVKEHSSSVIGSFLNFAKTLIQKFKDIFGIKSPSKVFFEIGGFMFKGLANAIKGPAAGKVLDCIVEYGQKIIEFFKNILGVHSPSKIFYAIGGFIMSGLALGLLSGAGPVMDTLKGIGTKIANSFTQEGGIGSKMATVFGGIGEGLKAMFANLLDIIKNLDFSTIAIIGTLVGIFLIIKKAFETAEKVTSMITGVGSNFVAGLYEVESALANLANAKARALVKEAQAKTWDAVAKIIFGIGLAIAAIAATIYLISKMDDDDLVKGGVVVGIIAGVIGAMVIYLVESTKKLAKAENATNAIQSVTGKLAGTLAAAALMIYGLKQMAETFGDLDGDQFARVLIGLVVVMGGLSGFIAATRLLSKADNIDKIGPMLAAIGGAIAAVAGAVKILGTVPTSSLIPAVATIVAISAILSGFMVMTKLLNNAANLEATGKMIGEAGGAIAKLVPMVVMLGTIDVLDAVKGVSIIGALGAIIAALIFVTRFASGSEHIDKVGTTIKSCADAINKLAALITLIGILPMSTITKGIGSIAALTVLVSYLMIFTRVASKAEGVEKTGPIIKSIAGGIAIMAAAVRIMGSMKQDDLIKGLVGVTAFTSIVAGLITLMHFMGGNEQKLGKSILSISLGIFALTIAAEVLSLVKIQALAKGVVAVSMIGAIMAGLIMATKFASGSEKTIKSLIWVIGGITLVTIGLGFIPTENLKNGVMAMTAIMGMLAAVMVASKYATASIKTVGLLVLGITALAGVVVALSMIPTNTSLTVETAASLGILISTMAGSLAILSMTVKDIKSTVAAAAGMLALCPTLLAIVATFALFPDVKMEIGNVTALGLLFGALSGSLIVLSRFTGNFAKMTAGAIGLAELCPILLGIVGIFRLFDGVEIGIDNVTALNRLLTVMTLALIPLQYVGRSMASFKATIMGLVTLAAMIPPLLTLVGVLAVMQYVDKCEENINLMVKVVGALTEMLLAISPLAPLAIMATTAITAMLLLMVPIGLLAAGLAFLNSKIPDFQTFLSTGCDIMIMLAGKMGEMAGAFINGIATGVIELLPTLATNLSEFGDNIGGFLEAMEKVTLQTFLGAATMALIIGLFTATELVAGITKIVTLGTASFGTLGKELGDFGKNIGPFTKAMEKVTPDMAESATAIADTVMTLAKADLLDAITKFLSFGTSNMANLGKQLGSFGTGMKDFADSLDGVKLNVLKQGASSAKLIAEACANIGNEGGFVSLFTGDNKPSDWAKELGPLGTGIKEFSDNVDGVDKAAVENATEAGKLITDMCDSINNEGGFISLLTGDNKPEDWAAQLKPLAQGIKDFSDIAPGINKDDVDIACQAGALITDMCDDINNEGGFISLLTGDNKPGEWGGELKNLAQGLKDFSDLSKDINKDDVNKGLDLAERLITANDNLTNEGGFISLFTGDNTFDKWGPQLKPFGEHLKEFSDAVAGINNSAVTTAGMAAQRIAGAAAKIGDKNVKIGNFKDFIKEIPTFGENLKSFYTSVFNINSDHFVEKTETLSEAISNLANITIDFTDANEEFTKGLDGIIKVLEDKHEKFQGAGSKLIGKIIAGMNTKTKTIKADDLKKKLQNMVSKLEELDEEFKNCGKNLVIGLVQGIKEAADEAYDAASALGETAVKGEMDGQDSHSPSKATYKAGIFLGQGLVNGIKSMDKTVYGEAFGMGNDAVDGLSKSFTSLNDILAQDIDYNPTIRPVLDLSDVTANAGAINSLLNSDRNLGVMGTIRTIGTSMDNRQNGDDKVVSALGELGSRLQTEPANVYNVNGVTYDDGTNVADAVSQLIRAAKIERRM